MRIVSLRTAEGQVVCERCSVADSPWPRMRGLLGRRGLESGEGLLLRPTGSVHTFFMRFPIDVVFLSREGEVLKIAQALPPWRTAGARRAKAVLELAADEAERHEIRVGTRLDLSVLAGSDSGPAANHPPASA
ncbi:MAG: DUF192 domain-containing protein [Actinobacteria bacterium]|nr:MAG: DUF192 domain-containing protein [Actinomycetota bacterium]